MKKRILPLVLAFILSLSCLPEAFAASTYQAPIINGPTDSKSDATRDFDPTNADVLHEVSPLARGASAPTSLYNLDNNDYSASGTFKIKLYSSYYFYPDENGKLYYEFTVTWPNSYMVQKGITVECWDKTDNKKVTSTSFSMTASGPEQLYGPAVSTGSRVISNLNTEHTYYFAVSKTSDAISATLEGTIWI